MAFLEYPQNINPLCCFIEFGVLLLFPWGKLYAYDTFTVKQSMPFPLSLSLLVCKHK